MLRLTLIISLIILVGLSIAMAFQLSQVKEEDRLLYEYLTVSSDPEKSVADKTVLSRQSRQATEKNIWFSKESRRLHFRLYAEQSGLQYARDYEETEVIEELQGVRSYMQEELYYLTAENKEAIEQSNGRLLLRNADPDLEQSWLDLDTPGLQPMQRIRYMEAEKAVYYYRSNRFVADEVHISRYIIPGNRLTEALDPDQKIMSGTAETVEFSLQEKELNFRAHRLKATFFSPRGVLK